MQHSSDYLLDGLVLVIIGNLKIFYIFKKVFLSLNKHICCFSC